MIYGIKETNFEEFIKKLNEYDKKFEVFATQIYPEFQKHQDVFYAIIYTKRVKQASTGNKQVSIGNARESKPTQEKKASEKQIKSLKISWKKPDEKLVLEELGFKGDFNNLTFADAWKYINKLRDTK